MSRAPAPAGQAQRPVWVRVWDWPVRLLHAALAASVALAWLSGEATLGVPQRWHHAAGYSVLACVALRLAWGWAAVGPLARRARFGGFVRGPRATARYARAVLQRCEPRYLGHNPLGAWMVLALLGTAALAAATGWLFTTDAFWGMAWLDRLHAGLAWALLALVTMHVAGVVFTARRHRENLLAAMVHGAKPAAPAAIDG